MVYKRALFVNIGKKILVNLKNIKDIQELIPESDLSQFYGFLSKNSGKGLIILYADNGVGECIFSLEISLLTYGIKLSQRSMVYCVLKFGNCCLLVRIKNIVIMNLKR